MAQLVQPTVKSDYVMSGPLAGFYAAQQMQDQQDAQQREFRDSDTVNAINQHNLSEAQLDSPVKAMKRELELLKGADEKQAWESGQMAEIAGAERAAKLKEQLLKMDDAELKKVQNRGDMALAAVNELGDPNDTDPSRVAKWSTIVKHAKQLGMNLPEQYSMEAHQRLLAASKIATQSAKQLNEIQMQKLRNQGQMDVAGLQAESHELTAQGNRASAERVANINAGASTENRREMDRIKNPGAYALDDLRKKAESGQPLDEKDLNKALQAHKLMDQSGEKEAAIKLFATKQSEFAAEGKLKEKTALELGMPKDSTPGDVATRFVEIEMAKKNTDGIKAQLSGAKVQTPQGVKPIEAITYKDIPVYSDLPSTKETKASSGPIQVKTVAEALALPKGTQFKDPEGKLRTR